MHSALSPTILLALLLAACDDEPLADDTSDTGPTDADGDGATVSGGDCDDADATRYPGAPEVVADMIDQDCDGADLCWLDADDDGYGASGTVASEDIDCWDDGESTVSTDCDDGDATIHPGAEEVPADGVDQDCDAGDLCYEDGDGDGYGRHWWTVGSLDLDCSDADESAVYTDCDDTDPTVRSGAVESCHNGKDDDCDGLLDCEDGDCAKDAACGEDCGRPGDEDGDGLADCEDDECWGPACLPAGVRARALGGTFAGTFHSSQRRGERWRFVGTAGGCEHCLTRGTTVDRRMRARSITGTVQVLPPGAASWAATATRTTCAWSAVSVAFAYDHEYHDVDCSHGQGWSGDLQYRADLEPPVRVGLRVDPGCRLAADPWFLPDLLAPHCRAGEVGTVVYSMPDLGCWWAEEGPRWYVGDLVTGTSVQDTTRRTTPGTDYCPNADISSTRELRRTYTGTLSLGSVYTALP